MSDSIAQAYQRASKKKPGLVYREQRLRRLLSQWKRGDWMYRADPSTTQNMQVALNALLRQQAVK